MDKFPLQDHTILQVVHGFPPASVTGTEQHVFDLSLELARRIPVFVFSRELRPDLSTYAERDDELQGVHVRRLAIPRLNGSPARLAQIYDPTVEAAFARYLEETAPDLVHIHHVLDLSLSLVAFAKRHGVRVVVTLHDYYFACPRINLIRFDHSICDGPRDGRRCGPCLGVPPPVPDGGPLITLARRARMRLSSRPELGQARAVLAAQAQALIARGEAVVRDAPDDVFAQRRAWAAHQLAQADALIAPSQFAADTMARQCPDLRQIRVVGHGTDVKRLRGVRRTGSDTVRFGFLGTIIEHKGVEVLLRAFSQLPRGTASLAIHGVAGDEVYAERMRRLAGEVGAVITGPYRPEDLPGLLSETDVVVVPSVAPESFGLVVREAFASGAPVIASRIGALEEAVRDGADGLLVPPGDAEALAAAMRRFVEEPGLLEAMRANLPRVKSVAENAAEIAAIYGEVLASRGGA